MSSRDEASLSSTRPSAWIWRPRTSLLLTPLRVVVEELAESMSLALPPPLERCRTRQACEDRIMLFGLRGDGLFV